MLVEFQVSITSKKPYKAITLAFEREVPALNKDWVVEITPNLRVRIIELMLNLQTRLVIATAYLSVLDDKELNNIVQDIRQHYPEARVISEW